jgi:hypothetical protein
VIRHAGRKARHPIAADDVARVFDDACIERLARIGKLPSGADRRVFGEGIRDAARIYAREARYPNANTLNDEIAGLHRAADRRLHAQVADWMERLSPQARGMLIERANRLGLELPPPNALLDNERRENACAAIVRLCAIGGRFVEGRLRATGRRSRKVWRPALYVPSKQRNFLRREAERNFLMWLRVAWVEATGEMPEAVGCMPAKTARHADESRAIGPFGRMLRECLRLLGAADTDAVELINDLHRRRRWMEQRPPLEGPRE